MAKALYRKYRPKTLSEVTGQEQVTRTLERALKQEKISHAYLFVGPRGTGKTSVARIFAHEINGFPYELEDDYVDIIEIDGASNRGIEDIRELREKVAIAPSEGKFKVYIIDEVHMLTTPAFNALLKTLEEPPEHVVFVMATTDVHKVPKTILSRAQNYTFRLADGETMRQFLRGVAEKEGIQITDEALGVVVRQGGGSFRDSLSVLDQVATLSDGEITRELVVAAMGLPEEEEVERILASYSRGDLGEISGTLREILSSGIKPELLVEGMIRRILAEPRPEWLGLLGRLPGVAAPFPDAKLLVALTAECAKDLEQVRIQAPKVVDEKKVAPKEITEKSTNGIAAEKVNTTTTAKKPVEGTKVPKITTSEAFDWSAFVYRVREANETVGKHLEKVKFAVNENVLHIFPTKKVSRAILMSANNLKLLTELTEGKEINVHEMGDEPSMMVFDAETELEKRTKDEWGKDNRKTDEQVNDANSEKQSTSVLDKVSEALGGKVVEDGIADPF